MVLRWVHAERPVLTCSLPYRLRWPGQWRASSQSRCCSITRAPARCGCLGAQVRKVCSCTPCASCRPGSRPYLHQSPTVDSCTACVISRACLNPRYVVRLRTKDALYQVLSVLNNTDICAAFKRAQHVQAVSIPDLAPWRLGQQQRPGWTLTALALWSHMAQPRCPAPA